MSVAALHARVDERAAALESEHRTRLQCRRGCSDCCVDELTVFEVEAERIRRRFPRLLAAGTPHPPGRCAFLDDEGACRVYPVRPYVCRTQGLPLRWTEETADGRALEYRDICPLNVEGGPLIEALDAASCWSIGPAEAELATLQAKADGGLWRRVRLRDLFGSSPRDGGSPP